MGVTCSDSGLGKVGFSSDWGAVRETLSSSGGKSLRDRLKQGWRGKASQQLQCLLCNAEAGVGIPKFLGMLAIPAPEGRHRGAPQLGS